MNASEVMVAEIKNRALLFCTDNPRFSCWLPMIEAAMLIGASVALEHDESAFQLEAWHKAFGTTQLTHAEARLNKAEKQSGCSECGCPIEVDDKCANCGRKPIDPAAFPHADCSR